MCPMRNWIALLCTVAVPGLAAAGEVEITARAGQTFPFYEQSFRFDPGPLLLPALPGVTVTPVQDQRVDGRGGLALGGGLTWYAREHFGVEWRIDATDLRMRTQDAVVHLRVDLSPLLPVISTDLSIPSTVQVDRPKPLSLNLRARTRGSFKAHVSAGLSYLPSLGFSIRSALETTGPTFFGFPLQLARLAVRADAHPDGEGESRFGFNAGAGAQWPVAGRLSLEVDGRYFRFARQTLTWTGEPGMALSPAEQELLLETLRGLGPVRFNPTFFQVTGGLSVRF
jgi:opacity protein-like surface antigen